MDFSSYPLIINSFTGMALWGEPPKPKRGPILDIGEVITWSISHLCMYLLSSFQLAIYFMCFDSLFILLVTPKPHYQCNMLLSHLVV